MSARYGYLEYTYAGKRDGNIGGELIYRLASSERHVERCAPSEIDNYDIVFVSVPSSGQLVDLYRLARRHNWDRRRACVVIGGAGVQNVNLLAGYVDYAVFGRVHDVMPELMQGLEQGGIHDILRDHMIAVDEPHAVTIRQAPLIAHSTFTEEFTGCPLKCKFCHYTYARKFAGKTNGYIQSLLTQGNADEVLYADIPSFKGKRGRIRTAIDGFSERIRYLYGKRISNQLIVDGINHLGEIGCRDAQDDFFGGHEINNKTVMTVYNICNFPYETQIDETEFRDNISLANPRSRVIFILHSTPFRASPATPMQWERVQLWPDWSARREQVILDKPNLLVKYSYTLEGPWSQLMAALVDRARPQDAVVAKATTYKQGTSADRAARFVDSVDCGYYLGEHDIDASPPGAWYLKSYLRDDQIRKIAHKMRRQRSQWVGIDQDAA